MALTNYFSARSNTQYEKAPALPRTATRSPTRSPTGANAVLETSQAYPTRSYSRRTFSSLVIWTERARWIQCGIRAIQLCAAIGLLICAFCLQGLQIEQSYVLRVPAFADVFLSSYSIYRLARYTMASNPSIALSYHLFAIVIDACIIPFYVYIALLPRGTAGTDNINKTLWTSVVVATTSQHKVLNATWIFAIIAGSIHVAAILLSCGLLIACYRMSCSNRLESHLTARPSRYKASTSDVSAVSHPYNDVQHTHQPRLSLSPQPDDDTGYKAHHQAATDASRFNHALPRPPLANRNLRSSRTNIMSFFTGNKNASIRSIGSSFYSDEEGAPPLPRKSSKRGSDIPLEPTYTDSRSMDENLRPHTTSHDADYAECAPHMIEPVVRASSSISAFDFGLSGNRYQAAAYRSVPQDSPLSSENTTPIPLPKSPKRQSRFIGAHLQPLQMNPPTPPPGATFAKPLGESDGNASAKSSLKSRFYGDLGLRTVDLPLAENQMSARTLQSAKDRVVSASGSDIADAGNAVYGSLGGADDDEMSYKGAGGVVTAGLRGRVASGRAAEEGRANGWSR